jgi:Arc/MetJ-type ribon-helix-helix transcriptional regulator
MNDIVIGVRMPAGLVKELKDLVPKNHFLDLSEALRSVVRAKCMQFSQPYSYELKKLREDLEKELAAKHKLDDKQKMITDLKKIIEELKQ